MLVCMNTENNNRCQTLMLAAMGTILTLVLSLGVYDKLVSIYIVKSSVC